VLDAAGVPTGTRVTLEGRDAGDGGGGVQPPARIDIDAFLSVPLRVRDGVVTVDGGPALLLAGSPVRAAVVTQGEVH